MADLTKIKEINLVIEKYFGENDTLDIIPAKKLMPDFIKAGIFTKDEKNGLPIRKVLRELDKTNQLDLIPFVHAQRKENTTYWYFIPANAEAPTKAYKQQEKSAESLKEISERLNNDENYVIDLCDAALGSKANRQKRFGFLLGDLHKDGKTKTSLPVDAFYAELNLVIEFKEFQNIETASNFNTSQKQTVSGVTRQEQRIIYDRRKAEILPENNIDLVVLSYSDFSCDSNNKIKRNESSDIKTVSDTLRKYIKSE